MEDNERRYHILKGQSFEFYQRDNITTLMPVQTNNVPTNYSQEEVVDNKNTDIDEENLICVDEITISKEYSEMLRASPAIVTPTPSVKKPFPERVVKCSGEGHVKSGVTLNIEKMPVRVIHETNAKKSNKQVIKMAVRNTPKAVVKKKQKKGK